MFCNMPKWWKNFFLTLDGKSAHTLEHEGCHLYSRLYHCEQCILRWLMNHFLQLVLHWEKDIFPLDCLSKYWWMLSGFLCSLQHEENLRSCFHNNNKYFPEQNGGHRSSRREEMNLAGYCLLVMLGVLEDREQKGKWGILRDDYNSRGPLGFPTAVAAEVRFDSGGFQLNQ